MSDETTSLIIRNMEKYGGSPAMLMRDSLQTLRNVLNNNHGIISAENPVALLLEMSATQTAGSIGKNWLLNRRQYPVAARTHEDLWYHLSDLDWVGAFALPSDATFVLAFDYAELESMMRPMANDDDGKLLRIPKGMRITVGNVDFMLDYPINIRQLRHGGFRVTYDTLEKSPIQQLESNIIEHSVVSIADVKHFLIRVRFIQVTEIVVEDSITSNTTIKINKNFEDQYYYARVFTGNDEQGWKELSTTHAPDIYDANKPTAVLKVTENATDSTLSVNIPKLYNNSITNNNGLVSNTLGSRVKIEIYSTLGEISMKLDEYTPNQFSYDFFPQGERKRDYSGIGDFSAALKSIRSMSIWSDTFISQGRDALSFEELRDRVINNTVGPNEVPVSNNAIEDKIQDYRFNITKAVDYVTSRAYWAVRDMPNPESSKLITPAASSVETLSTSISALIGTGTVIDNRARVTIMPDSVYTMKNGKLSMLMKSDIDRIKEMNTENKAKAVNENEMFFSPFHYVVDTNHDTIKLRPYYLDKPVARTKSFITANNKIDIALGIELYTIERTPKGYRLIVTMRSNDVYRKLRNDEYWVQLLIHPYKDKGYVYLAGKFIGRTNEDEPMFQFDLDTRFDLDENHNLIINNMSLQGFGELDTPIPLESKWELIFGFYGQMDNWSRIKLDDLVGLHLVNPDAKACLMESIDVRLGHYLEYLWTRARTHATEYAYKRYDKNIPLLYKEDVYDKDETTGSIVNIVNGEVQYNLRHRKGDQVIGKDGQPVWLHREGDVMLDENGRPIIKEPRKVNRRLELMLVDATYLFATDEIAKSYREEIVETFLDWIVDDLKPINDKTLEQTRILYYPSSTMGEFKVMYNEGIETFINAAQSLQVSFTVNKQVYLDYDIQEKIKSASVKVIYEELKKNTVSISSIVAALVKEHGKDVLGIKVRNLGNNDDIVSFTVLDEGKRATLRKKLIVQSDDTLAVSEDITFNFILHESETTLI